MTTCSRQIFAFSRDGGLPLSKWLYNVNKRTHAPVPAVWFSVILSLLLGLLSFAGPSAIGAVFSLVVAGQYVAYSIPIAARFIGGRKIELGPFNLGKLVRSYYYYYPSGNLSFPLTTDEEYSCSSDCCDFYDFYHNRLPVPI